MATEKVEVLLVVSALEVDRNTKTQIVNTYVNIKEGNMGRGDGSSKLDNTATVEALKENNKGIMVMNP